MHSCIREAIRPGVTTAALDKIGREVIERRGARSNFLGYGHPPFSGVICASPNDVIVHGIPGPTVLREGDIISIEIGRAHVCTPVTNAHLVCRLLLEKKK